MTPPLPLHEVAAFLQGAADGAVAVAARWDVIAAAFIGGFSREVLGGRKRARKVAADVRAAVEGAIEAHEREHHAPAAAKGV